MNAPFEYCYRDAGNWKNYGEVVFAGEPSDDLVARVRKALRDGEWFIADQVGVPEMFFERPDGADDHCWHELAAISATDLEPTDVRTFARFVKDIERAKTDGWREFNVSARASAHNPAAENRHSDESIRGRQR